MSQLRSIAGAYGAMARNANKVLGLRWALKMKGDKDRVLECTTGVFDGLVAMVNPQDSWVVSQGDGSAPKANEF